MNHPIRMKSGGERTGHLPAAVLLLLLLTIGMPAFASAGEPLLINMFLGKEVIAQPSQVDVYFNIVNTSSEERMLNVTLLNPDGEICDGFGEGGTVRLGPGISASYTDVWQVTKEQLNAGRIAYTVVYTQLDGSGREISKRVPVSHAIQQAELYRLLVDRTVAPKSAYPGQLVTITYLLQNVGALDLSNIDIRDLGVENTHASVPMLASGDAKEVSCSFVMGDVAVATVAEISYTYFTDGQWQIKTGKMQAIKIEAKEKLVWIDLASDQLEAAPGDTIRLAVAIENQSTTALRNISLSDESMGNIGSGFSLDIGKRYENEISRIVTQTSTFQIKMIAQTETGEEIILVSNPVTVRAAPLDSQASSKPHKDPIQASIEMTPAALQGPSTVRVRIAIRNAGNVPANVTLFDPHGAVCEGFGKQGSIQLSPGEEATYEGPCAVTQCQLSAGNVVYSIDSEMQSGEGDAIFASRPVLAAIHSLTSQ